MFMHRERNGSKKRSRRQRRTTTKCRWMTLHSYPFLPVDLPRGHCCVEKQEEELTEKVPAQEEAIVGTS